MKPIYKLFLVTLCLAFSFGVKAQDGLPTNPVPGKCYAKCVTKDEYKDSVVSVVEKPSYTELNVVPAVYRDVVDSFVVKPEIRKYVCSEPVFKKVKMKIHNKEPYNKITIIPVRFQPSTQRVQIAPTTERWEMGGKAPDCPSIDPNDCRLVWYKQYPEQFQNIPIQIIETPADTTKREIQFDAREVEYEVIDKPSTCKEILIQPVQYEKYKKTLLVKDETVETKVVPAVLKKVTIRKLIKRAGMTVWREVECDFLTGKVIPILYELNDHRLTEVAKTTIDTTLLVMMVNEPLLKVELGSHTDSRGDADKNLELSQRRAQSVVDYLISRGIESNRVIAKGYGETRLLNDCADGATCSEEKHSQNRRTEFRIIE